MPGARRRVGLGARFALLSRESLLLANNVLLVVACGAVLLGTLYPLALDALGLGKISVGPPYFDTVFVPLLTPLVFLMGVGPLARWKQAALPDLRRACAGRPAARSSPALLVGLGTAASASSAARPADGVLDRRARSPPIWSSGCGPRRRHAAPASLPPARA